MVLSPSLAGLADLEERRRRAASPRIGPRLSLAPSRTACSETWLELEEKGSNDGFDSPEGKGVSDEEQLRKAALPSASWIKASRGSVAKRFSSRYLRDTHQDRSSLSIAPAPVPKS